MKNTIERVLGIGAFICVLFLSEAHAEFQWIPLKIGMSASVAKKSLEGAGWQPRITYKKTSEDKLEHNFGTAGMLFSAGFVEVETCSGTGLSPCIFNYRNDQGACLRVTTVGEFSPGEYEPGVNAWTRECPPIAIWSIEPESEQITNVIAFPSAKFPDQYRMMQDKKVQSAISAMIKSVSLELSVVSKDCGVVNAFYTPQSKSITLCYEYLKDGFMFTQTQYADYSDVTRVNLQAGILMGVLLHELGHAVIDLKDFPVLGGEEDAADMVATIVMLQFIKTNPDQGKQIFTGNLAYMWGRKLNALDKLIYGRRLFADEHPMNEQRAFNMACLAYGSDPKLFANLAQDLKLPQARAVRCQKEYAKAYAAVMRIGKTTAH